MHVVEPDRPVCGDTSDEEASSCSPSASFASGPAWAAFGALSGFTTCPITRAVQSSWCCRSIVQSIFQRSKADAQTVSADPRTLQSPLSLPTSSTQECSPSPLRLAARCSRPLPAGSPPAAAPALPHASCRPRAPQHRHSLHPPCAGAVSPTRACGAMAGSTRFLTRASTRSSRRGWTCEWAFWVPQ